MTRITRIREILSNWIMGRPRSMIFAARTNKGERKGRNQDAVYVSLWAPDVICAVVADGIGGHDRGRRAARICVSQFVQFAEESSFQRVKEEGLNEDIAHLILRQVIDKANQMIYEEALSRDASMGTTCTAAIVKADDKEDHAPTCFYANVGDSRIYLVNDRISQLSTDHSFAQHLADSGSISPEEAQHHEKKNILTNFVGIGSQIRIDVGTKQLSSGSTLLLSTDGLHNHTMDDSEFVKATIDSNTPARACKRLIKRAKRNGASDNMSLVIIRFRAGA